MNFGVCMAPPQRKFCSYAYAVIDGYLYSRVYGIWFFCKMESANRDEAERCLRYAQTAKDKKEARRWAEKSYRLYATTECQGGLL